MKKRKKIIALGLVLSLIVPVYATEIQEKKDELEAAQDTIKASEQEIEDNKQKQSQINQEIITFDDQISVIEDKIIEVDGQLEGKLQEVEQTQTELEEAIERKDSQYEATKERMVEMYKNSKTGYMEVILSSENMMDLLNRTQYIQVISTHDNKLLDSYREQQVIIEDKKQILVEEQQVIELLQEEQESHREELEQARSQKNQQLGVLKTEEDVLYAQLEEMEELSKQLEEEIKELTAKNNMPYDGGDLGWPVPGRSYISSGYGGRIHPITGKQQFHSGIDIPAPYGLPVVAAADGTVIMSQYYGSYGNTIIIDHGGGVATLYAHNSSLSVSVGTKVTRGQEVAKIGSTGSSTGNHSHFEVRENGNHVNPWNYLSN